MAKDVIVVGNRVEMKVVYKVFRAEVMEDVTYTSHFFQWVEHNVAQVAVPIYKGEVVPVQVNDEFELSFYTPKGLYQCRAIVKERVRQDNIAAINLKLTSEMEKYHRRQYFRMECIIDLSYALLTETHKDLYIKRGKCQTNEEMFQTDQQLMELEKEVIKFYGGTIFDISGGGMRFNSMHQEEPETTILLKPCFPVELKKKIPVLMARVISSNPIKNREGLFDNRIEYVNISNNEREALIYYIFKLERERRKREIE